jgi:hypothetical protein
MRARMLRAEAAGERASAAQRAERIRKAGARELGQSRAGAAASGVKLTSESVLEAERQLTQNVEQDALLTILSGNNRARVGELSADYVQAGAINSAISGMADGYGKWKRSRPMPATAAPVDGVPNARGDY